MKHLLSTLAVMLISLNVLFAQDSDLKKDLARAVDGIKTAFDAGKSRDQSYAQMKESLELLKKVSEKDEEGYQSYKSFLDMIYDWEHSKDPLQWNKAGLLYFYDVIDEGNYERAAQLFEMAKIRRCAGSSNNLALCYLTGKGRETDYAKAISLFEEDAQNGIAWSYYHLADMTLKGLGTVADKEKALEYVNKAIAIEPAAEMIALRDTITGKSDTDNNNMVYYCIGGGLILLLLICGLLFKKKK